tara:strand:+ start:295 stop:1314 length:1020 start_codon:yes stop_codon:yes gene_type:complete
MALVGSGNSISFKDIQTEFGRPSNGSFGKYRLNNDNGNSENVGSLTNLPLDEGIPTTGQIKFSDFYSKRLNIIVDFYTEDLERQNIKTRFGDSDKIKVIGPRDGKPESTSGKKIIAHVNKLVSANEQSKIDGRLSCSLMTGEWDPDTKLIINVGSVGKIIGAGGNGGRGSEGAGDFFAGKNGTSAIGINTTQTVSIINNGLISCGFGGGGGGKGGSKRVSTGKKSSTIAVSSGGGGGGGAGSPVGLGGEKGTGGTGGTDGSAGGDGKINTGGASGDGGDGDGISLDGGLGGDSEVSATAGDNSGGAAGNDGFLIVTIGDSAPDITGSKNGANSLDTTPI